MIVWYRGGLGQKAVDVRCCRVPNDPAVQLILHRYYHDIIKVEPVDRSTIVDYEVRSGNGVRGDNGKKKQDYRAG